MTQDSFVGAGPLPAGDRAMREHCERLQRLASALAGGGTGAAIGAEAQILRRDIDSTMRAHHRAEEALLFPALLESMAGSDAVCLRELGESLTAEHRALEDCWRHVSRLLERAESHSQAPGSDRLRGFVDAYLRHVEREEQELFPMAMRLLGVEELARLAPGPGAQATE